MEDINSKWIRIHLEMIECTHRKLQQKNKKGAHNGETLDSATEHHENNLQECKRTRIIETNKYAK